MKKSSDMKSKGRMGNEDESKEMSNLEDKSDVISCQKEDVRRRTMPMTIQRAMSWSAMKLRAVR